MGRFLQFIITQVRTYGMLSKPSFQVMFTQVKCFDKSFNKLSPGYGPENTKYQRLTGKSMKRRSIPDKELC